MKNLKEFTKKYIAGFITGLFIFGTIGVYAAAVFPSNQTTYDNKTTGMQATEVQGAIDELYTTCFPPTAGDQILDKEEIVTSGDGLYEDEYEDGKYTYKGANPNNYVTFNNEKAGWRIISINSDGSIKIMRNTSIGNRAWDTSNNNNWNRPASLNTYLNGDYYNSLNTIAQNQIVAKDFSIGGVKYNDTNLSNTISDENATKWNGKVALATASEYIRSNSNQSSCGTMNQIWNSTSCGNTTWMHNGTLWWILSPYFGNNYSGYRINSNGMLYFGTNSEVSATYNNVRPTITLSSEVQITGGDGSQNNPYTIE